MSSQTEGNERDRIPFEPTGNRKKSVKNRPSAQPAARQETEVSPAGRKANRAIPEDVSQRMFRRMLVFSGVPLSLAMLSIVASYFIISRHLFELPRTAVLVVSLGFFGMSVLGLSYGVLSASWDENRIGKPLGWKEFVTNWGRMSEARRTSRRKTRGRD